MKNRKKKLCPRCSSVLRYEKDKNLKKEYPYVCTHCDENFYSVEAVRTTKKSKNNKSISKKIVSDILKNIPINRETVIGWHWIDDDTFVSEFKISNEVKEILKTDNSSIEIEYQVDTGEFFYSTYEGGWDEGNVAVPIELDMSCLNEKVLKFVNCYAIR